MNDQNFAEWSFRGIKERGGGEDRKRLKQAVDAAL